MGSSKTRSTCVACVYPSRFVDFFVRCTAVSKAITQMSPHMSNMKAMSAMKLFFFFQWTYPDCSVWPWAWARLCCTERARGGSDKAKQRSLCSLGDQIWLAAAWPWMSVGKGWNSCDVSTPLTALYLRRESDFYICSVQHCWTFSWDPVTGAVSTIALLQRQ